ncbi:alpha-galactosidase [Solihabitans fulvus]|uniref:Alpha-galactosidase n=1 Tax=Solihabitans fulvus TaxID=1892852 RepID=A0A5B2XD28_9PSEU|nr:glycoside hydrolase family 36 protein [Solihabitans fulvus]KAA2261567.1 alpha-galactosidase [Solihabitans fulvus]
MRATTILVGDLTVEVSATGCEHLTADTSALAEGVVELRVTAHGGERATVTVSWEMPCLDLVGYWTPRSQDHRWLPAVWAEPRTTSLLTDAPVGSLVAGADTNRCTFAAAETRRPVTIAVGVREETGEYEVRVTHELAVGEEPDSLRLLLDLSDRHFAACLADVADWWRADHRRAPVPAVARRPAYSTWYAHHQHVDAAAVEREAALAGKLGCDTIIVDDGWQTSDTRRGYAFCGDWAPDPVKFPDPAGHVARVRALGLGYLLWYALPFLGRDSAAWPRFHDRCLSYDEDLRAGVLDPRYPQVRAHLVASCAQAVRTWGADGLKLDFVDAFAVPSPPTVGRDADCDSVEEGVDRLLRELDSTLRETNPEPLVEFRQGYVSPGLWRYATMVRATDCPLTPAENRVRTVDLRLVCGPLAVHADMLTWHPDSPPEQVAGQLINVLFAVPQISVPLKEIDPAQRDVVAFWLGFVREHAVVLQYGEFRPSGLELGYPLVRATDGRTSIVGLYAETVVEFPQRCRELLVANASAADRVTVRAAEDLTGLRVTAHDCRGRVVASVEDIDLPAGVHDLPVPVGGLLSLRRPL